MKESQTEKRGTVDYIYMLQRVIAIFAAISVFFPFMNPTRICDRTDRCDIRCCWWLYVPW